MITMPPYNYWFVLSYHDWGFVRCRILTAMERVRTYVYQVKQNMILFSIFRCEGLPRYACFYLRIST